MLSAVKTPVGYWYRCVKFDAVFWLAIVPYWAWCYRRLQHATMVVVAALVAAHVYIAWRRYCCGVVAVAWPRWCEPVAVVMGGVMLVDGTASMWHERGKAQHLLAWVPFALIGAAVAGAHARKWYDPTALGSYYN